MTSVTMSARLPPGTVQQNLLIPKTGGGYWPHKVDIFRPVSYSAGFIGLHGGGGTKEDFSRATGVVTSARGKPLTNAAINWALLSTLHIMVVYVQGQACTGVDPSLGAGNNPFNPHDVNTVSASNPQGVATWDNGFMWSGVDDMGFLRDLKIYLLAVEGAGFGISLFGHSNGAMMTMKAWYLASVAGVSFTHYGVASGCAAKLYVGHAAPSIIHPVYFEWGGLDDVLDITGGPFPTSPPTYHFYDALLTQNSENISVADIQYTELGELSQIIGPFEQLKVAATALGQTGPMVGGDGTTTPCVVGTETVWRYGGGNAVGRLISGANHGLVTHRQCTYRYFLSDFTKFVAAT